MERMIKICHVSSAHGSDDFRIFYNECCSLVKKNFDVFFVVQGDSYESSGVHIIGAGEAPASRKQRMTVFARKVVQIALSLNCDIYHLHDPELLRFVSVFVRNGKKVIFDSHEDYKYLFLAKEWIPMLEEDDKVALLEEIAIIDIIEEDIIKQDKQSQVNYLSTLVDKGIITRNEARKQLGYAPVDGGDELMISYSDPNQNKINGDQQEDKNIEEENDEEES